MATNCYGAGKSGNMTGSKPSYSAGKSPNMSGAKPNYSSGKSSGTNRKGSPSSSHAGKGVK